MTIEEVKQAKKHDDLVMYQDRLCSVLEVNKPIGKVLIREDERSSFGEAVSRLVNPDQLELVKFGVEDE